MNHHALFFQQVDKDAAKKTAEDILSKSEYQPVEFEPLEIDPLEIDPEFDVPSGVGIGAGFVQILLIAGIIAILGFFIWYFRDALFARNVKKKKKKDASATEQLEKQYTKRDVWLERAEQAERDRKYDEAVHYRYLALVAGLAEKDKVPLSDSLTCGEYSELLPKQIAASEFTAVRSTFENSRYGGIAAMADDTHSLKNLDSSILTTIDHVDQSETQNAEAGQ